MKKLTTACAATLASALILTGCGDGRATAPAAPAGAEAPKAAKVAAEPLVEAGADMAVCYVDDGTPAAAMIADAVRTAKAREFSRMDAETKAEAEAFLAKAGLDDIDIRWAVVSATGIADAIKSGGAKLPEVAAAVSFSHDLRRIFGAISETDEFKAEEEPPLVETTIAGAPAIKSSGIPLPGPDGIIFLNVAAASIDGEILVVATSEDVLAREVARYRGDESAKSVPAGKGAAASGFVERIGDMVSEATKGNPDELRMLDMFMPNASGILLGLGRFESRLAAEGGSPVATVELGMKSAEDAAQLKGLADLFVTPTLQNAAEGEGEEAELAREILANHSIAVDGSTFRARLTVTPLLLKAYMKAVEEAH